VRRRDIEAVLDQLIRAYPALAELEGFSKDSCILACRAATDALRPAGFRVRPFGCQALITNQAFMDGAAENPDDPLAAQGAWSVGIGFGPAARDVGDPHRFNGHAVLLVQDRYIVDLTIDQAARSERDIHVAPCWHEIPGNSRTTVLSGREGIAFRFNGAYITYRMRPDVTARLVTAPDWTMRSFRQGEEKRRSVRRLTERISSELRLEALRR
jgi:hypothetical protein